MKTRLVLLLAVILLLTASIVVNDTAQGTPISIKVGTLGGITFPQGMLGNFYNAGWQAGGYVWVSGPTIGLRLQTDYHKMKSPGTWFGTARHSGKLTLTAVLLEMTFSPANNATVKPYAVIGGGTVSWKSVGYDVVYEELTEYSSRDGAFAFGGGLRLPIRSVNVFIEAQYLVVFEENDSLKMLMLTAGLGLSVL